MSTIARALTPISVALTVLAFNPSEGMEQRETTATVKPVLTLQLARKVAAATLAAGHCAANHVCAVAVEDDGGYLLYFERQESAHVIDVQIAIQKARSAALYGMSTAQLADQLAKGRTNILKMPELLPLPGGIPLLIDGQVVGAVGVGGAADAEAQAGAAVLGK